MKRMLTLLVSFMFFVACGSHVQHRVQKGDTLYSIGFRYHQDYRDIARWNELRSPYILSEGQWLRVAPPVKEWWEDEFPDRARQIARTHVPNSSGAAKDRFVSKNNKNENRNTRTNTRLSEEEVEWSWPVRGKIKINTGKKKGLSFFGSEGQPVYSAADGKVVYSGDGLLGYGNLVIVKHNQTYLSAYAHNQTILVKEGEKVITGQQIASMGNTGTDRTTLYFEIRRHG